MLEFTFPIFAFQMLAMTSRYLILPVALRLSRNSLVHSTLMSSSNITVISNLKGLGIVYLLYLYLGKYRRGDLHENLFIMLCDHSCFRRERIIEYCLPASDGPLAKQSIKDFVRNVAARTPAPGGGSVSALLGALV